jgi:hypothetical protein
MDGVSPFAHVSDAKQDECMFTRLHVPSPFNAFDALILISLDISLQSGIIRMPLYVRDRVTGCACGRCPLWHNPIFIF